MNEKNKNVMVWGCVACTCFKEGLTSPPPFADRVRIDQFGVPGIGLHSLSSFTELDILDTWKSSACSHPHMMLGNRFLGYAEELEDLSDRLREMPQFLPNLFGAVEGAAKVDSVSESFIAELVLSDVEVFTSNRDFGEGLYLINTETGDELRDFRMAFGLHLGPHGGKEIWLYDNDDDTLTMEAALSLGFGRDEVFQAERVEQRLIGIVETPDWTWRLVEFVDMDTGQAYQCFAPIKASYDDPTALPNLGFRTSKGEKHPPIREGFPRFLHLEERKRTRDPRRYEHIVKALVGLCKLSVRTGNRIRWYQRNGNENKVVTAM